MHEPRIYDSLVNGWEHEPRRPDKRLHTKDKTYLVDVPNAPSVIQYPFRQRRLARVDMRRDTDVPLELEPPFVLLRELVDRVLLDKLFRGLRRFDSSSGGSVPTQRPETSRENRRVASVWPCPETCLEDVRGQHPRQ